MTQPPSAVQVTVDTEANPALKKNPRVIPPEILGGPGEEEETEEEKEERLTWEQVKPTARNVESLGGYFLKPEDFEAIYELALDGFNGPESYFTDFFEESPRGNWVIQDMISLMEVFKDYRVDLPK